MADRRITHLKRRLAVFLGQSRRDTQVNAELATAIKDVLRRPAKKGWRTYLVGGVLRDLLLSPGRTWPRDIDFLVEGATQEELDAEFEDPTERHTRFGGLHLVKKVRLPLTAYSIHFDTWCLQDTWGLKFSGRAANIENFLQTPFLNIDCIAARLESDATCALYLNRFMDGIDSQTIEINFLPNPFPLVCLVRALILAVQLQFAIGPQLAGFACEYAARSSETDLIDAQLSHYGIVRVEPGELHDWLRTIEVEYSAGSERIKLLTPPARQLALWNDWPPVVRAQIQHKAG